MGRELKRVPLDFKWPLNKVWMGFLNPHYKGHQSQCKTCEGTGNTPEAREISDRWYGNGKTPFRPEDRGSKPFGSNDPLVWAINKRKVEAASEYYGTGEVAIILECLRMCCIWNVSWCHHLNAEDVAALVAAGRLMDFTHTWSRESGWKPKDPPVVPTPDEVNRWSLQGLGHDSINHWVCVRAECKRLGIKTTCPDCQGDGEIWDSKENRLKAERWEKEEPPKGEAYQIWETVSEGSPVSPPFATPEALADWMVAHDDSITNSTTYVQWLKFINGPGWAPSMVMEDNKLMTGVESVTQQSNES